MKKIIMVLTICLCIGVLFSCSSEGDSSNDGTNDNIQMANSASENSALTREQILNVLNKVYVAEVSSAVSDKTAISSNNGLSSESVPEYLSEEFIEKLTTENYGEYKKLFADYSQKVSDVIKSMVSELPEKCSFSYWPRWAPNFGRRQVSNYTVLDPGAVPEDGEEFVLFLSYNFYELNFNKEYDKYYDADIDSLAEKYSDVGDILIEFLGEWYFFDTKTLELEEIELFPDHEKVKDMYFDLIADKINEMGNTVAGE